MLGRLQTVLASIATLLLLTVSCEELGTGEGGDGALGVTIFKPEISYTAKVQFVAVEAPGEWTLDIHYLSEDEGWASLDRSSGEGDTDGIVLTCALNGTGVDRSLELVLSCGGKTGSCSLKQLAKGSRPSKDMTNATPITTGWMELPGMAEDDPFTLYHHDMTVSGKKVRNYSYYWDPDALVSRWVAYPLNNALIDGYHTREDAWGVLDPNLARNRQPVLSVEGGWGLWGYARGHQLPQADRINVSSPTREANVATYYGTNITVQDYDFNSGIWARLEGAVRGWASKLDTLYVVTGVLVDEMDRSFAFDSDGKQVRIPYAYFKALLAYTGATETKRIKFKTTMGDTGYYAAIGFLFENDNRSEYLSEDYMKQARSIKDLEKATGFNFFAHLNDAVGDQTAAKIESSTISWWKYN